jgi:glycosyltransferase involved in cell wall biosynthesis
MGVPAITTRYNGAAEILADGAGMVVDSPRDIGQVAGAMQLLADPQASGEYREACTRAAERVSMARHVESLLDVYRKLAAEA